VSEARTEDRLGRLEADVHEIKTTLARLEPMIIRIDERLNTELPHLRTELSHLATKAELEKKPGRGELWGAIAAMVGAQAVIAAVLAVILTWTAPARGAEAPSQPPYSCQLLYDEQRKCAFGSCDKRVVERLTRECLRDGGRT
jgi:hypothetical protein